MMQGVLRGGKGHRIGGAGGVAGPAGFQGCKEQVESRTEEEGEQDFGDEDAGEEEDAKGREDGEAGVEGGLALEGCGGPTIAEKSEEKNGEALGEMRGEGVEAEEAERDGVEPVGERGFFEIADAIHMEGDPVAGERHVAGGTGVGAVGVVKQRRREE